MGCYRGGRVCCGARDHGGGGAGARRRRMAPPCHVATQNRVGWCACDRDGSGSRRPVPEIVALRSYAPAGADAATRVGLVVLVYPFVWRCVSRCAGASTVTQVQSTVQRSCEPLKSSAPTVTRAPPSPVYGNRNTRARLTHRSSRSRVGSARAHAVPHPLSSVVGGWCVGPIVVRLKALEKDQGSSPPSHTLR